MQSDSVLRGSWFLLPFALACGAPPDATDAALAGAPRNAVPAATLAVPVPVAPLAPDTLEVIEPAAPDAPAAPEAPLQRTKLEPEGFDVPIAEGRPMLPAWSTRTERGPAVGEALTLDARGTWSQIYGYTSAPPSGVRSVAEWEPADGVLVAWQDELGDFVVDLVEAAAPRARVALVTPDLSYSRGVADYLASRGVNLSQIDFLEYPSDSFWTRDYGPMRVVLADGRPAFVDMRYYPDRARDDATPTLFARHLGIPAYRPNLSAEGGNLINNGAGLCVTTTWLLDENPHLGQRGIEDTLARFFGCRRTVFLEPIYGEGTGHVDMSTMFVDRNTVLVGRYDRRDDAENADTLDRNAAALSGLAIEGGGTLRVVRIPMPAHDWETFASYTNSIVLNGRVLVPVYDFDRRYEAQALEVYRQVLPPGTEIVPIDSSEAITWGGAIHCTMMQFNRTPLTAPTQPTQPTTPTTPTAPTGGVLEKSEQPAAAIRDNATVRRSLTLSGEGVAGAVEVTVDIAHTYVGDLTITLTHGSASATLYRGSGAGRDLRQTFTTQAFAGAAAAGTWTLAVADTAAQDTGTLRAWGVKVRTTGGGGSTPAPAGTLESTRRLAIPDLRSVTDTIQATAPGRATIVEVSVRITHTYIGDLRVTLEHGNVRAVLHDQAGGSAANLVQTWRLEHFGSTDTAGPWVLRIEDTASADVGTLESWSLKVQ